MSATYKVSVLPAVLWLGAPQHQNIFQKLQKHTKAERPRGASAQHDLEESESKFIVVYFEQLVVPPTPSPTPRRKKNKQTKKNLWFHTPFRKCLLSVKVLRCSSSSGPPLPFLGEKGFRRPSGFTPPTWLGPTWFGLELGGWRSRWMIRPSWGAKTHCIP